MVGSTKDNEVGVEGEDALPPLPVRASGYVSGVTKRMLHLGQLTMHSPVELLVWRDDLAGVGVGVGWIEVGWIETYYVTTSPTWWW